MVHWIRANEPVSFSHWLVHHHTVAIMQLMVGADSVDLDDPAVLAAFRLSVLDLVTIDAATELRQIAFAVELDEIVGDNYNVIDDLGRLDATRDDHDDFALDASQVDLWRRWLLTRIDTILVEAGTRPLSRVGVDTRPTLAALNALFGSLMIGDMTMNDPGQLLPFLRDYIDYHGSFDQAPESSSSSSSSPSATVTVHAIDMSMQLPASNLYVCRRDRDVLCCTRDVRRAGTFLQGLGGKRQGRDQGRVPDACVIGQWRR